MEGMESQVKPEEKVLYQCVWCKRVFEKRMLKVGETICPYCGFSVIRKAKPMAAKLIITSELMKEQRLLTSS